MGAQATAVEIDVAPADQIDTLRLQILVADARQWEAADILVVVTNMGSEVQADMKRLGVDPGHFERKVTL